MKLFPILNSFSVCRQFTKILIEFLSSLNHYLLHFYHLLYSGTYTNSLFLDLWFSINPLPVRSSWWECCAKSLKRSRKNGFLFFEKCDVLRWRAIRCECVFIEKSNSNEKVRLCNKRIMTSHNYLTYWQTDLIKSKTDFNIVAFPYN